MTGHREPRFDWGDAVVTPEGKGKVVASAQTIRGWLYRVDLAKGGYWTGLEAALTPQRRRK